METAVVGLHSPEISSPSNKITRGARKRKRSSDGDAATNDEPSATRPRGRGDRSSHGYEGSFQLTRLVRTDTAYTLPSSTGSASAAGTKTPPAPVAVLSGPGRVPVPAPEPVPVAGLQTEPQTYQDYQLHSTNSGPSGHSRAQGRCPEPIFCHDNGAMSIACTGAPTPYSHRSTELPLLTTYSPPFHQPQWYTPGQPGDIIAQSHLQQVPTSSPPQSVSLQLININGAAYPQHFGLVSPHQIDLLSQDNVNASIVDAGLVAPFQHIHTFQAQAFGLSQPQPSGQAIVHLPHHHLSAPLLPPAPAPPPPPPLLTPAPPSYKEHKPLVLPPQGAQQLEESSFSFQPPQESRVSYTAYSDPHFKHDPSADTKALGYSFSTQMPMGGGRCFPDSHHQAPRNEYLAQPPIGQLQVISHTSGGAISPVYTGSGKAVNGAVDVQNGASYGQRHTDMTESADWQQTAGYPTEEVHEESGGESGPGDTDVDCDADECSSEPISGKEETAHSSTLKQEDSASSSGLKPRRSPLSPAHRKQTAETRKIKACTRCRMQKMRCETDKLDPTGDCVGCKTFSKTSKKTIHRMPCYRGKITDAILFRSGGLELTDRWKGTEMKDVADRINPKDIRTISFTLGICTEPIQVEVVAFQAQSGDITARYWVIPDGEHGVRKKKDLAHYCLANIQKTAAYFEEYIKKHAISVMKSERAGGRMPPRDVIEKTYDRAINRYYDLVAKPAITATEEREVRFLGNIFTLWFAMRHSTGSSWICGEELLGMKPETKDETYPLFGRVSVPRMILAQFDSINHTRLLSKYGKLVLGELESLMSRSQPNWWFSVYTCLFILLREASWVSEDRYRHARSNYGSAPWPDPTNPGDRHKTAMGMMSSSDYQLVMEAYTDPSVQRQLDVWRRYKAENGRGELSRPFE
ncbi:tetratricopeptide repeat domain containing [Trichoderma arundinaceum]|uniref:Tetratricopeptide repeat domain containing n=1 Tax=Trichoderma arundinaceum TaxID=490622 RepID=A0A395NC59_TRIAR|nr:tetratricopeptide repeat domain containing [Trichoderma arundinaceum]